MRLSRRSILIGTGSALLASLTPSWAEGIHIVDGRAFGTTLRITLPHGVDGAAAAVRSIVRSVDETMSPFRTGSEISRFNASSSSDWQPLSPQTCAVVQEALRVAERSERAFDPTVGPIVGRYGFGPIRRASNGSYRDIMARDDAVRKLNPELTLDLCGIAKGHAVDRIAAALDGLGAPAFLIELGGEVFARGLHPSGRAWQVGIERPSDGPPTLLHVLHLGGHAIATSGDWVNGYVIAGRRYCHIVDPARRLPKDNAIASVSVLMPTAALADAFATALMAKDLQAGVTLAERERIPALFIIRDEGGLREVMTAGFAGAMLT